MWLHQPFNSPLWSFAGNNKLMHVYSVKLNLLKFVLLKKVHPVDIGFAIYLLHVVVEHFGNNFIIFFDE